MTFTMPPIPRDLKTYNHAGFQVSFSFTKYLDCEFRRSRKKTPCRWDIWSFFNEELPMIIRIIDKKTSHNKQERKKYIEFEAWYKRESHEPSKTHIVQEGMWVNNGFVYPEERRVGLHRAVLASKEISSISNEKKFSRYIVALTTAESKKVGIFTVPAKYSDGRDLYIKATILWSMIASPGRNLIRWESTLKREYFSNVLGRMQQFLRLKPNILIRNVEELRVRSEFQYSEIVCVEHPETKEIIPGLIVGETAISYIQKSSKTVFFLQLVEYYSFHEEEPSFVPLQIEAEGKRLSVAVCLLRTAPERVVRHWGNRPILLEEIDNGKMDQVRLCLEVFCDRS
jgi:hypothetical protein